MKLLARIMIVISGLSCAIALGHAADTARATPKTSHVVDRTLVCRVGFSNGARLVLITAQSAARSGSTLNWLAQATVATPGSPLPGKNYRPTLAGVTAGWPPPPPLSSGGLGYDNTRCGATTRSVPLNKKGLKGGVAGAFGDELRCSASRTVLVHVRATFREPVTAEPTKKGDFVAASGRILAGQIAVRSLGGRQLVYLDVSDSGRARLFSGKDCT
jgi:hypothetical protein